MEILSSDHNGKWAHTTGSTERPDLSVLTNPATDRDHNLPLPVYETVAELVPKPGNSYTTNHGHIDAFTAKMDDATCYPVRVSHPHYLASDTAVSSGTAWWTHPDLEHYQKIMRGLQKLGYVAIFVGPPSGFKAEDVSISKAIHDQHRILDVLLPTLDGINPGQVIGIGGSRAAIKGFGLSVPQYAGDRKTPYIDITAPPAPRAFTNAELPRVVKHVLDEMRSTEKVISESTRRGQLHRYVKTLLPRDLSHGINSARMLPSFLNGEVGRIVDCSSPDTVTHIVQFIQDYWALIGAYEALFTDRANVAIQNEPGNHIEGIARPTTRRDTYERLKHIRDIRGFDGPFVPRDLVEQVLPLSPHAQREKEQRELNAARKNRLYVPFVRKAA